MAELFLVERRKVERPVAAPDLPPDWPERERALDVRASWVVEAPAGSGKTGLLLQRYLKLLADETVTDPEQVLAITFTVKATAELRERVLAQLAGAASGSPVEDRFARQTRELAAAVLRRDTALGWGLLERPERLSIRTIDSVCAEIARSLPVLSGSGGRLAPVLDAAPLYAEAARRTFQQLGRADAGLEAALRTVLLHRDGNLAECERLLAGMLAWRDQWGELVPLAGGALTDEVLDDTVLPRLERALDQAICAGLTHLAKSIPADILQALVFLANEMGNAAGYKGAPSPIALCARLNTAPGDTAEHLDHWRALIHLLTTKETTWRKRIAERDLGFLMEKHHNARLKELVEHLSTEEELLEPMKRAKCLPPAKYPPEQWAVAKALFRVLQRALVELQLVFAERGECDFTELGLLARTALGRDAHGDDLAAALGMRLQHLLVDEMQDTSTSQYRLVELLTAGWDGRSQTLFLVGDPKQSIYLFRQARVERFVRTMRTEQVGELRVGVLRLTANFRSQARLVEQGNGDFARLFPAGKVPLHPEDVPFVAAEPVRAATPAEGRAWHTTVLAPVEKSQAKAAARVKQARENASTIRQIAQSWRARPLPEGRTKPWTMAVLVRSRTHLAEIVTALKEAAVPFRAVEIEALGERQEVLDLFALTRALLHPADRVAWLAVLRAPWCGLTLADLHLLAGADDDRWAEVTVEELMERRGELLSPDGAQRLERVWTVMRAAAGLRGRLTLSQWVERAWRSLAGDAWLGEEERANAERYLRLLDELEGDGFSLAMLEARLKTLYAEAAVTPGAVDLMTVHGAKGLEWDVVVVPALERRGQTTRGRLLTWMELDSVNTEAAHVVLAPILGKGEASRELNAWVNSMVASREAAERKRLLYVACTRAREELHLFAAPEANAKGEVSVAADSLLKAAWPAAKDHFQGVPKQAKVLQVPVIVDMEEGLALAAASSEAEELERPAVLRRLPVGFDFTGRLRECASSAHAASDEDNGTPAGFERPEGSFAARAFGNAVHGFLELLAGRVFAGHSAEALLAGLPGWEARVSAVLRGDGLPPAMVERLAQGVLVALGNTLRDPVGRWVLAAHPQAASEREIATPSGTVRLDRIFRAGASPLESGNEYRWVVDFKTTAHGKAGLEAFLEEERTRYAGQMAAYARVLGGSGVRVMLYYPVVPGMVWWVEQ